MQRLPASVFDLSPSSKIFHLPRYNILTGAQKLTGNCIIYHIKSSEKNSEKELETKTI